MRVMGEVTYINPVISEMKVKSSNNRRIYLNGVVDDDMAMEVSYYVNKILESDKINPTNKEVTFIVNSYGGSVIAGNSIIGNIIRLKNANFKTIAIIESCAFSMAYDIIVNCDLRIGYKHSQYLLHQTSCGQDGELKEFERAIEFQKKVWEQSIDYYTKNTKLTRERIKEIYDRKENYYFLADEALENGTVHEVII